MAKIPECRAFTGGAQQRSMTQYTPEVLSEMKKKAQKRQKLKAKIDAALKK